MLHKINKTFSLIEKLTKWLLIIMLSSIFVFIVYTASIPSITESQITNGMNEKIVVGIVGREPDEESSELYLCNNDQWYGNCREAMKSGSSKYLIWHFGIDTLLIVGLDENLIVVFHGTGDT